jgi:hypothetical protein
LTIASDAQYTGFTDTARLFKFLATLPELNQTGPFSFGSSEPWVSVVVAACDSRGNYAHNGEFIPQVNVVELICAYTAPTEWCEALAVRIADALGWKVFGHDEGRQIHPPI